MRITAFLMTDVKLCSDTSITISTLFHHSSMIVCISDLLEILPTSIHDCVIRKTLPVSVIASSTLMAHFTDAQTSNRERQAHGERRFSVTKPLETRSELPKWAFIPKGITKQKTIYCKLLRVFEGML